MSNKKRLNDILSNLKENREEKAYHATVKFVPNAQKIIGNRMPLLNTIAMEYRKSDFELVEQLWKMEWYETRILAAKILGKIAKKDPEKTLQLVFLFSAETDNWALCDTIGMQSVKLLVTTHADEIFALARKLNTSENLWQRRLSLVLVEWYTRKKNWHPVIIQLLDNLKNEEEYYVKKAILWVKKNFQKGK